MHPCRRSSSIQRRSFVATLAFAALLLAGCGTQDRVNPFAPTVDPSRQAGAVASVGKSSKPKHKNDGSQGRSGTSSGSIAGGVTSGSFGDPIGTEKPAEPLSIE